MRRNSLVLTVIAGGILTIAMIQAMRGSAWPTALFVMAGFLLPYVSAKLLYALKFRRLYRMMAVIFSVSVLTLIAWLGKHPSPERAFRDVTGVELPAGAQVIRVDRGWYDGRITIVHFRANVAEVRAAMQACDAAMSSSSLDERVIDAAMDEGRPFAEAWRSKVTWAAMVAPWLVTPPVWTKPRCSRWYFADRLIADRPSGNQGVWFLWDDVTGATVVCAGTD